MESQQNLEDYHTVNKQTKFKENLISYIFTQELFT